MESKSVDTRSIYRELGATLSYNMRLGNGMEVEPWLKAAVRKEFVDDNRVKVNNDGNFVNDLSGRRGIYQAGIKASFSSSLSGHLGVGYSHGAKWHLNRSQFGIRIDHDLASISDHSLASQSITIWHASDH